LLPLIEQRVGRVGEAAAGESAVEFQALGLVGGDEAEADAGAFFGVADIGLIEILARQQSSVQKDRLQPQPARSYLQKLEAPRAAENLMIVIVQAEEVAEADDARAVHRREGKVDALAK